MASRASSAIGGFGLGLVYLLLDLRNVEVPDLLFYPLVALAALMIVYGLWPLAKAAWKYANTGQWPERNTKRVGVRMKGGTGKFLRPKVRKMDVAIDTEDTELQMEDPDIG